VKDEKELRRVGSKYYLFYLKAHPPKFGAFPPAGI